MISALSITRKTWTGFRCAEMPEIRFPSIPSHEVRDSFVHPRRWDNRCQNRRSTRLDKRPEAAYYAVRKCIALRYIEGQSDPEGWCHGR